MREVRGERERGESGEARLPAESQYFLRAVAGACRTPAAVAHGRQLTAPSSALPENKSE